MTNTVFGFNFGSMNIERVCGDKDGPHVIKVKTPKAEFTVRATKTGQVRFFSSTSDECELVSKHYINQLEEIARLKTKIEKLKDQ
tara:strand:- start:12104 stop:12358 length:255 start_codon:yes stop_codon:yes gene_type:complete